MHIQKASQSFHTPTFSQEKTSFIKPWMTQGLLCSINHKNKLFSQKLKNPSTRNIHAYNQFRNCLNKAIINAKKMYYQNEFSKYQYNPKKTWETLHKLLRHKSKKNVMPSKLINDEGKELNDTVDIAEGFNEFLTGIGTKLKQKINHSTMDPLELVQPTPNEDMILSPVNEYDVEQIILQLKDVGAGIDNINSKKFKSSYKPIISQLTYFFNLCIATATFPKALKIAVVKPIYKGGDSCLLANYRPISILPFISKILEKIIYIQLSTYIATNDILTDRQFGFRTKHSTYMPIMLIWFGLVRIRLLRSDLTISEPWDEGDGFE